MSGLLPWLAVAGAGALHGLNPASGWMCATAWGVRRGDGAQAIHALAPIAAGHMASVALVAASVAFGMGMDRTLLQIPAGALLAMVAAWRFWGHRGGLASLRAPASHAGLALWSFMMSTAHGAGMMLVPALIPLCIGDSPAREITASGSLALALAAVAVHALAMLAVTGMMALLACRGVHAGRRLLQSVVRAPVHEPF